MPPDERQPRERAVPCVLCTFPTWDLDMVCERCDEETVAQAERATADAAPKP